MKDTKGVRQVLENELDTLWECANDMATDDWGGDTKRWLEEKNNCIDETLKAIQEIMLGMLPEPPEVDEDSSIEDICRAQGAVKVTKLIEQNIRGGFRSE